MSTLAGIGAAGTPFRASRGGVMDANRTAPAVPQTARSQARSFLAKALPWPHSGEGYINIVWAETRAGSSKPCWSGRATRTPDEAINVLTWIGSRPGRRDIYVCMSLQRQAEQKTSKNGNKYLSAMRSRQHVVALRSVYLDIDIKSGEHGYGSPEEAIRSADFIRVTKLPLPSICVKSGGGFHVYYTLSRALTREEWEPLAHALVEAGKRNGLKADYQVTINSTRLLRVPGTLNHKQDTPRLVSLAAIQPELDYKVEELWEALASSKVVFRGRQEEEQFLNPALFPPRPPLDADLASDLSAGIETPESAEAEHKRGCGRVWLHPRHTIEWRPGPCQPAVEPHNARRSVLHGRQGRRPRDGQPASRLHRSEHRRAVQP